MTKFRSRENGDSVAPFRTLRLASLTRVPNSAARRDMSNVSTLSRLRLPSAKRTSVGRGCRSEPGITFGASNHLSNLILTKHRGVRFSPLTRGRTDGTSWDPDEQRRIDENKQWRRTDPAEDAWDIDKERDAVMYKRESLERLLSMTPKEPTPDRPVTCLNCGAKVCKRSDETSKDKAHVHRKSYRDAFVSLSVYRDASGISACDDEKDEKDQEASAWWPPRNATQCRCKTCDTKLGWRVADDPAETAGSFFALLTSRLGVGRDSGSEE